MTLIVVVLSVLVVAALWSVVTSTMLRAAIGLALVSALLAIVLFIVGARLAALFELSIGAGLIPVLFVSVVSLTRREQQEERPAIRRLHWRRSWPLILVLFAAGALLVLFHPTIPAGQAGGNAGGGAGLGGAARVAAGGLQAATAAAGARASLWVARRIDLFGQALIVLAGAFGVVVLFRERRR